MNKSEKKDKFNILIVDDMDINLEFTRSLLEEFDKYEAVTCLSGFEALDILKEDKENDFDLILLDIKMPDMDGFETCKKIRELGKTLPVIFISGLNESENLAKGFDAGGNDYIKKPYRIFELIARIDSQLKLYSLAKLQERMKSLEMYNALVVSTNHNLRQPLTIIAGNLELLMMKEGDNLDKISKRFLQIADESVDEAVKILDKIKYNNNPTFENYTKNLKMVKLLESMIDDSNLSFEDDWANPDI